MLNNLNNRVTRGWNFIRLIRLALAITIIVQAVSTSNLLFAVLGGLLMFQTVFNYGCCGASGCDINYSNSTKSSGATEEVTTFKELK